MPKFNKIPFYLQPHSSSGAKTLKKWVCSSNFPSITWFRVDLNRPFVPQGPTLGQRHAAGEEGDGARVREDHQPGQRVPDHQLLGQRQARGAGEGGGHGHAGWGEDRINVSRPGGRAPSSLVRSEWAQSLSYQPSFSSPPTQVLDPNMDLRTVKHFIWKSGGDLTLHYRQKSTWKLPFLNKNSSSFANHHAPLTSSTPNPIVWSRVAASVRIRWNVWGCGLMVYHREVTRTSRSSRQTPGR